MTATTTASVTASTTAPFGHALMDQVLDCIARDFSLWDQLTYARRTECGTVYCFAGLACILHGLQPWFRPHCDTTTMLKDGRYINDVAVQLLGITGIQAMTLFSSRNTLVDLKAIIDQFKDGVSEPVPVTWDDDNEWPDDDE